MLDRLLDNFAIFNDELSAVVIFKGFKYIKNIEMFILFLII